MKKILAFALLSCLMGCDQGTRTSSSGTLGGIRLNIAARKVSVSPDSLLLAIAVEGQNLSEYRAELDSSRGTDVQVPFGALVQIRARVFSYGDTTQTCDTSFAMPSSPDVQLVLTMLAVVFPKTTLSQQPRTQAAQGQAFLDTLLLSGAGADSTAMFLVAGPVGMTLTGNAIAYSPVTNTLPSWVKRSATERDARPATMVHLL